MIATVHAPHREHNGFDQIGLLVDPPLNPKAQVKFMMRNEDSKVCSEATGFPARDMLSLGQRSLDPLYVTYAAGWEGAIRTAWRNTVTTIRTRKRCSGRLWFHSARRPALAVPRIGQNTASAHVPSRHSLAAVAFLKKTPPSRVPLSPRFVSSAGPIAFRHSIRPHPDGSRAVWNQ